MPSKKMTFTRFKRAMVPYLFLIPAIIIFSVYLIYPACYALIMSFFDWGAAVNTVFVGITNFVHMMSDATFWISIANTLIYICAVPVKVILALVLATLLNQKIKAEAFFRGALFFPYVLSEVIVGIIWKAMFNPTYGFINTFLSWLHLPGQNWLAMQNRAMLVIILVSMWKGLGANLIIYIAGIKGISPTYYEAASIDGATAFQKFWHITLPCLKPTTIFVTTMAIIGSFNMFDIPFVMTQGGPGSATTTFVQYIYEVAFSRFQFGYASALAFVFFIVLFILTILQRRILSQGSDQG